MLMYDGCTCTFVFLDCIRGFKQMSLYLHYGRIPWTKGKYLSRFILSIQKLLNYSEWEIFAANSTLSILTVYLKCRNIIWGLSVH